MRRQNVIIIFGMLLFLSSSTYAEKREGDNLFGYNEFDFFEEEKAPSKKPVGKEAQITEAKPGNFWTEPIRTPDGRVQYYTPPPVVTQFLDHPTEDNARAYLGWNTLRLGKIQRAQGVLKNLIKKDYPHLAGKIRRNTPGGESFQGGTGQKEKAQVLYFHRKGCTYCRKQTKVFQDLTKVGRIKVKVIEAATGNLPIMPFPVVRDAGESMQYNVKVYPTSIFFIKGERYKFEGFVSNEAIERLEGIL